MIRDTHDRNDPLNSVGVVLKDIDKSLYQEIKDTIADGKPVLLCQSRQEKCSMRDYTKLVLVLDRSGSMSTVKPAMEEVLNGYITAQKTEPGECRVTLVQFDDRYETVFKNLPIGEVRPITLSPRGGTALLDAIGQTIDEVGAELAAMPESERPSKVLFVVTTDGCENQSTKYLPAVPAMGSLALPKASKVNEMVSHQRDVYKWEFVFLGADQDAIATAAGMGFNPALALNYENTSSGVRGMGNKLSKMSSSYRSAPSAGRGTIAMGLVASETNNKVTAKDTEEWDEMMAKQKAAAQTPTK
jgi:hypothetical protein